MTINYYTSRLLLKVQIFVLKIYKQNSLILVSISLLYANMLLLINLFESERPENQKIFSFKVVSGAVVH